MAYALLSRTLCALACVVYKHRRHYESEWLSPTPLLCSLFHFPFFRALFSFSLSLCLFRYLFFSCFIHSQPKHINGELLLLLNADCLYTMQEITKKIPTTHISIYKSATSFGGYKHVDLKSDLYYPANFAIVHIDHSQPRKTIQTHPTFK